MEHPLVAIVSICVHKKTLFLPLFENLFDFGRKINKMDVNKRLIVNCSDS